MISSPGVGSGLDIGSLIKQLVAIEQQPLLRLAAREAEIQGQLSAYGQVKGALSAFQGSLRTLQDLDDFKVYSATSSDKDVLVATASSTAAKGVFNIEVERLAENHRLAADVAFANVNTTTIGTNGDTLTIDVGGDDFTIEYGGSTLGEIRDAINAAGSNSGVTASILSDDAGHRLILSGRETGSSHFVSVSYSAADPFSFQDLNVDRNADAVFTNADLDAELIIEGQFTATRTSNTITDVISGVTLNLLEAGDTTVKIDSNLAAVEDRVGAVVTSFNALVTTMRTLGRGALNDDRGTISRIEGQLRAVLNSPADVSGVFSSIFEVGLASNYVIGSDSPSNGQLKLDKDALHSALQIDMESVANLFADDNGGIVTRLLGVVDGLLGFGGLVDAKTSSADSRIDTLTEQRASMQRRIALFEARITEQFTAMDTLVNRLQQTGSFLTQQLAALPKIRVG